jgi:predicted O-methyltransferase YrrM
MTLNNPTITRLVKSQHFDHRGVTYPLAHSTPPEVCTQYYTLIVKQHFKAILEIGTLYGLSTLFLAAGAQQTGGSVTTIDLRLPKRTWFNGVDIENVHEVAERLVKEAGFADIVTFIEGNSNAVLADLYRNHKTFDFILIDGSHEYPVALIDFIYADTLLNTGGVIALDDVGANMARKTSLNGGPNRLLSIIFSSGRYQLEPVNANVCLVRKLPH